MKKTNFVLYLFCLTFLIICGHPLKADTTANQVRVKSSANYDSFLISESIAFTTAMANLAASESYISAMTQSPDIKQLFKEIGAGKYEQPAAVYFLTLAPQKRENLLETALSLEMRTLEPVVKQELLKKIDGFAFAKMTNGQYGSAFIGAAAILETGKSYIEPKDWKGAVSVLLVFQGSYASLTQFSESGDGVISAHATFIGFNDMMRENLDKNRDPFLGVLAEDFFSVQKK